MRSHKHFNFIRYIQAINNMCEEVVWTQGGHWRFFHNDMIAPRLNTTPLPFHYSFEYTYGAHPKASTKMYGFPLMRSKTKYMECNFSKRWSVSSL